MTPDQRANLEFKIAFSKTNLRWLAGEPDTDENRQAIATNEQAIAEANALLAKAQGD